MTEAHEADSLVGRERSEALVLRPQMLDLVRDMEHKLRLNDHKRPWSTYNREEAWWLLSKLKGEVEELEQAMRSESGEAVRLEAADVANFALMLHAVAVAHGRIGEP